MLRRGRPAGRRSPSRRPGAPRARLTRRPWPRRQRHLDPAGHAVRAEGELRLRAAACRRAPARSAPGRSRGADVPAAWPRRSRASPARARAAAPRRSRPTSATSSRPPSSLQRAVLHRVGRQLVQGERQGLDAVEAERHGRAGDGHPAVLRAGRGPAAPGGRSPPGRPRRSLAWPIRLLHAAEGGEPVGERLERAALAERLPGDRLHHRQQVARAVLQLGDQDAAGAPRPGSGW